MRALLALATAAALLAPRPARPCTLVSSGMQPRLTALRVLATVGEPRSELGYELTWDGGPASGPVGAVIPVPAGSVPAESDLGIDAESLAMTELEAVTAPQVVFPSEAGCGEQPAPAAPWPVLPDARRLWSDDADLRVVDTAEAVDAWAADNGFVLGGRVREEVEASLSAGGAVLLVVLQAQAPASTSGLLRVRFSGDVDVALRTAALSAASPLAVTVWVLGATTFHTEGWPSVALTDLDRDLLRRAGSLERAVADEAAATGHRLFLITVALSREEVLAREDARWGAWHEELDTLLVGGERITRLDARVPAGAADRDVRLVPDPSPREVSPVLDLRPDPMAHGASLLGDGPFGALSALVAALWLLRRRRG